MRPIWWPKLGIRALQLTHPKWTHTQREQWVAIYAAAPGEQLGVWCLAQGHLSRGIEGGESAGHSLPHRETLPDWDSNSQPFDFKSDSLNIRPQLPRFCLFFFFLLTGLRGGGRGVSSRTWSLAVFSLIPSPFQDHVGVHLTQLQWDIQYRGDRGLVKGSDSE